MLSIKLSIKFDKNGVGPNFGRLCNKLMWSPCTYTFNHRRVFFLHE
jgi:hypothetical protein